MSKHCDKNCNCDNCNNNYNNNNNHNRNHGNFSPNNCVREPIRFGLVPPAPNYPLPAFTGDIYVDVSLRKWYKYQCTAWYDITSNINLLVSFGPTGPTGPIGKTGPTGPTGPSLNGGIILDSIKVFINEKTGSDLNNGLTSATAVKTIKKGIYILGKFTAKEGILQLEGNIPFNLGTNPVLDFYPATSFIGSIIVQGTFINNVTDTVISIPSPSGVGPFDTWSKLNIMNGGLIPFDYVKSFIKNNTQNKIYTILSNSSSSIDVITGKGASNGLPDPWNVGESLTLFKIKNIIQFSGELKILNSSNVNITFQYIWIKPAALLSAWNNVKLQVITFRGCRMDTNSFRSYTGSMILEGCYSENRNFETIFSPIEQNTSKIFNSVWLNGPGTEFNDTCSAFFVYLTDCLSVNASFNVQSADFEAFSIKMTGITSHIGIKIQNGTIFKLTNVFLENIASVTFPVSLIESSGGKGVIINLNAVNNSTQSNNSCIALGFSSNLYLNGSTYLKSTGKCIESDGGSYLDIFSNPLNMIINPIANRPLISLDNNSRMSVRLSSDHIHVYETLIPIPTFNSTLILVQTGSSFSLNNSSGNGSVKFLTDSKNIFSIIDSYLSILTTSGNTILTNLRNDGSGIFCNSQSKFNERTQPPGNIIHSTKQTSLTNATVVLDSGSSTSLTPNLTDITATNLLICGSLPTIPGPGPYSTSINDYSLINTKNCFASF